MECFLFVLFHSPLLRKLSPHIWTASVMTFRCQLLRYLEFLFKERKSRRGWEGLVLIHIVKWLTLPLLGDMRGLASQRVKARLTLLPWAAKRGIQREVWDMLWQSSLLLSSSSPTLWTKTRYYGKHYLLYFKKPTKYLWCSHHICW